MCSSGHVLPNAVEPAMVGGRPSREEGDVVFSRAPAWSVRFLRAASTLPRVA
ncbi:hypothetical protein MINT15_29240 [Saccharomonospora viridis]|uniref:Uncharacterized protein n=1 Tax=Saccharomonospora viridis TaxID=1852 RepID=A0A837D5F6_9PSEU|nr:hypothetical protein MINT15_29240 [Saccharomonospora viridis]